MPLDTIARAAAWLAAVRAAAAKMVAKRGARQKSACRHHRRPQ